MVRLKLSLFGTLRLENDGQALTIGRRKVIALLAYLAVTGQPQNRDHLLALLWPEFDTPSARNNLRRDLSYLRKLLGGGFLQSDHNQVSLMSSEQFWLDAAAFKEHLAAYKAHHHDQDELCPDCQLALQRAVDLAPAEFMAGFSLVDAPDFNDWLFFCRQEFKTLLAEALQALDQFHAHSGNYERAIALARRWLDLDTYHEPAHQRLMQLYAWSGQQAAALRQYEECRRLLAEEFDMQPSPESKRLLTAIRTQSLAPPAPAGEAKADSLASANIPPPEEDPAAAPASNLPHYTTSFFGRQQELTDIADRITDPGCRLLTILAPGGMGKSRLAIAAAKEQLDQFSDGVIFVPLAPVAPPKPGTAINPLVGAIADALDLSFHGQETPEQQIFNHLRSRKLLIVLDNFEHLLPVVTFVSDLLSQGPDIKVLVTSRERLRLQEEWLFTLHGLAWPTDSNSPQDGAKFDAVQLFTQRAQQVRSSFALAEEYSAIVRICQLVEGMPLGLELAAAWVFQLSCGEIADEIEAEIDFLATEMHNVPDRHRSIRSVFSYSWARLSPAEQNVLQKLSVFRGGFDRAAARAVAGASLPNLASLASKSLLTLADNGRYTIHELLRQFAAAKLADDGPLEQETMAAHAHHFLTFLRDQESRIQSAEGPAALAAMNGEIDNIRVAIQTALDIDLGLFTRPVAYSLSVMDRNAVESETILSLIVGRLKKAYGQQPQSENENSQIKRLQVAHFLTSLGLKQLNLNRLQEAEDSAKDALMWTASLPGKEALVIKAECLSLMTFIQYGRNEYPAALASASAEAALRLEMGDATGYANSQHRCELISLQIGDYGAAREYLEAALNAWGENRLGASGYWNERAKLATIEGELLEADAFLQRSVAQLTDLGNTYSLSYIWREWGNVARLRGRYAEAKAYGWKSIAMAEKLHNVDARILCDWFFGNVAVDEGNYELALRYFEAHTRRGPLRQELLGGPGWAYLGLDDDAAAQQCFANTLQLTVSYQARPIGLDALVGMAHLKVRASQIEEALALLALVRAHPSSHYESREKARRLWDELAAELPADLVARADVRGRNLDLEDTAAALLAEG